jgi:hypothetical protein
MYKRCRYEIAVRGRVAAGELNAGSPVLMQVAGGDDLATRLAIETDQSGLIGLMRHLHGRGLVILSVQRAG